MKIRTTSVEKTVTHADLKKLMPQLFQLQRDSEYRGVELGTPITVKKKLLGKGNKLLVKSGVLFRKPDIGDTEMVWIDPGEIEVGTFHTHVADYSGELFHGTYSDVPMMSSGDFCESVDTNPDKIECVSGYVDCEKNTKKCRVINCFRLRKTKKGDLPKLTEEVRRKVCSDSEVKGNESFYYKHERKLWRKLISETKNSL